MTQEPVSNRSIAIGTIIAAAVIGGVLLWSLSQSDAPLQKPSDSPPSPTAEPSAAPLPAPDAAGPGMAEVEARLKQLASQGCTVMQKPVGVKGTTVWNPRFLEGDDAPCVNLIAATGNPGIKVRTIVRRPDGEKVETKNLVSTLDYVFCSDMGGPHSINILCPSNDRYTFAAVSCERADALRRQSRREDTDTAP